MHVCRSCCGGCVCTLSTVPNYSGCNHPNTTISLTGITSPGGGTITVTATSSNTSIVATPTVTYTSPSTTGSVAIVFGGPNGTSTITVTVSSTMCSSVTRTASFTAIANTARPPSYDQSSLPASQTLNNAGPAVTFTVTGIAPSADIPLAGNSNFCSNGVGTLAVTASSNNPGICPNPTVIYTSPNATATVTMLANMFTSGTGIITITLTQSNEFTAIGCCINEVTYSFPFTVI